MAHSEEELVFVAAFQERLRFTREKELDWSREYLAARLGITYGQLIRYETRPGAGFPIYLLSKLAQITDKPIHYWLGVTADDVRKGRGRLSLSVVEK